VKNFQDKRARERIVFSKVSLVLLTVLVLYLAHSVWGVYVKERLTRENLEQSSARLSVLKERKGNLESAVAQLSTARGVEEEVRAKYQVGRPGEEVIIVVPGSTTSTPIVPKIRTSVSFFTKLQALLKR
jgi:cell division protein FtsB